MRLNGDRLVVIRLVILVWLISVTCRSLNYEAERSCYTGGPKQTPTRI